MTELQCFSDEVLIKNISRRVAWVQNNQTLHFLALEEWTILSGVFSGLHLGGNEQVARN